MAISGHSNEQSLVSYNKRPSQQHLMECSDIISHHFMNTPSQSRKNFPVNQRRADEYVQLKVCSMAVIL